LTKITEPTDRVSTIRLRDVVGLLRRGALLGLLVAVIAGGTAFVITSNAAPTFRATAALIATQPSSSLLSLNVVAPPQVDPSVYRSALIEGYLVRDALARIDGVAPSQRELERFLRNVRVSVDSRLTSSVIRIDVDHTDPDYAARVANTVTTELLVWDRERGHRALEQGVAIIERAIRDIDAELIAGVSPSRQTALEALRQQRVQEYERAVAALSSTVVVGLLETLRVASVPEVAIGPRVVFRTFVAAVLGLIIGFGMVLVRTMLDTRVGDRDAAMMVTGMPVMAEFVRLTRRVRRPSDETAAFLRTNVTLATRETKPRVLIVTSVSTANEREGVAAALAESYARSGSRTLLIDADLRHLGATEFLNVASADVAPFEVHLANADRRFPPVSVLVESKRSFDFIPSFTSVRFPGDLLSQGLPPQLEDWKRQYDTIIFDSTPVVPFADTLTIAPLATGVLLCASARTTKREPLETAVNLLERGRVNVIGLVLTELSPVRAPRHVRLSGQHEVDLRLTNPSQTAPGTVQPGRVATRR